MSVDYVLPTGQTLPDLLEVKLTFGGIENAEPVFYSLSGVQGGTAGLPSSVIRLVLQADDVSALPTGRYNYQVEVIEHRGEEASAPKLLTGAADIVNRRDSEFGVGWWLDSLDRIVTGEDGYYDGHDGGGQGVLLVRGDGTSGWFAENADGGYDSPAGSFTTLVKNIGGDFTLTHTDGTEDKFLADGRLDKRTDRNGNVIDYEYDVADANSNGIANELKWIEDIYGLKTTYTYAAGRLDYVTDFAERVTDFQIGTTGDTTGYVNKIVETDPDGAGTLAAPETDFTYYVGSSWDGDLFQGLLYTITTPGIQTQSGLDRPSTTISYGAAGRFESAVNGDETAWELTPAQIAGLATGSTEMAPVAVLRPDQIQATYVNERDKTWTYTVDRFGYQTSMTDPLGMATPNDANDYIWKYSRNSDGLTMRKTEPKGAGGTANFTNTLTTSYRYDDRGNLLKATYAQDKLLGGGKITESWEYDEEFSQVTQHVDARGFKTINILDSRGNVLEIRQQVDITSTTYVDDDSTKWVTTKFEYTDGGSLTPGHDLPGGLVDLVTDARGVKTRTVYYDNDDEGVEDHEHGLVKTILSGLGSGEEQTGTVDGIVVNASITHFQYDEARNANVVIQQMGALDPAENEPTGEDDTDRYSRYEYDGLNRLIEVQLPEAEHVDPAGEIDIFAPTTVYAYDKEGFVIKQTDALGRYTEYANDEMGRLTKTTLPSAQFYNTANPASPITATPTIVNTYDDAGNLETVTDANGNTTTYFHNDRNEVTEIHLPATDDHGASVTKYAYDSVGNLKSVRDPLDNGGANGSRETTYVYDSLHRQTKITMPDPDWDIFNGTGSTHTAPIVDFVYDDSGNLLSQTNPHEAATGSPPKTEYTYDGLGRRTKSEAPSVAYVPNDYTLSGGTLPTGRPTTEYEYDANGNLEFLFDAEGNGTLFVYDSLNRQIAIVLPSTDQHDAPVTELVYNDAGELVSRKDPPVNGGSTARETTFVYDTLGRQIFVIQPEVEVEGEEDPVAPTTAYLYDGVGNLRFTVDADQVAGHPGEMPLDKALDAIADDMATEVVYDALNRQISVIYPLIGLTSSTGTETTGRPTTETAYDKNGNRRMAKDANENKTVYDYDAQNRVIKVTAPDPDGATTTLVSPITEYRYDKAGNRAETIEQFQVEQSIQSRRTKVAYDNLNRPFRQTTQLKPSGAGAFGADLTKSETTYYVTGLTKESKNYKLVTNTTADTTTYEYDDLGRRTKVSVPTTGTATDNTRSAYDRVGNLRLLTDPAENRTLLTYDEIYRQIGEATLTNEHDEVTREMVYDQAGNLISKTDRNGHEIAYIYDVLGRRTQEEWVGTEGGGYTAQYEYDLTGKLIGAFDGDSMHTVLTDIVFALDAMGHPISVEQKLTGFAGENVDQFDSLLEYGYDLAGRRTRTKVSVEGTHDFTNSYDYDHANRVTAIEQTGPKVNSKTVSYKYNGDGQINAVTRHNAIRSAVDADNLVGTSKYTHKFDGENPQGRLVKLEHKDSAAENVVRYDWVYEDNGLLASQNIVRRDHPETAGGRTYQYDANGQLLGDGSLTWEYAANGNRTGAGYTMHLDNRLFEDPHYEYTYDAEGNLTRKTIKPFTKVLDSYYGQSTGEVKIAGPPVGGQNWTNIPHGYSSSQLVHRVPVSGSGVADASVTWNFQDLAPGVYDLYATWNTDIDPVDEHHEPASQAYFHVAAPGSATSHEVNMQSAPTNDETVGGTVWKRLRANITVTATGTGITVQLTTAGATASSGSDWKYIIADAVRLKRLDIEGDVERTDYTWDYRNRLIEVVQYTDLGGEHPQLTFTYGYDVQDRRVMTKAEGTHSSTSHFVYDGLHAVHEITASSMSTLTDQHVLWGPGVDQIVAFDDTELIPVTGVRIDATAWTLTDQSGSVNDLIGRRSGDDVSLLIQTQQYSSFGSPTTIDWIGTGAPFSESLHYFFAGQQFDKDLGLQYSRARYYDPLLARFVSQDPSGFAGGDSNLYRRANNSPNNATDPSGLANFWNVYTWGIDDSMQSWGDFFNPWADSNPYWEIRAGFNTGWETGNKAVTNALVDTVISFGTLGFLDGSSVGLHWKENAQDNAYGYGWSYLIARGSWEILFGFGMGKVAQLPGYISKAAFAWDVAGNVVGAGRAAGDMLENGPNVGNLSQVFFAGMGITGNVVGLKRARTAAGVRSANSLAADFAANPAGTSLTRTVDAGEVGGQLYGAERLEKLEGYLGRRGVKLEVGSPDLPFGKAGAFVANADGSARLLLRADPSTQLVWHELGHFIQWRRIGSDAYRALPRSTSFHAPEQFVFDLLEKPRRWYRLTEEYRIHSSEYIEEVGGFR